MRFLVIDDKDSELERAKTAATEKGIEILTLNPNHESDYLEWPSWPVDWLPVHFKSGASEYPPAWYDAVRHLEVDGIATDLVWELSRMNYMEPGNPKVETLPETPYGLLVYIEATKVGKPVIICTDAQGHAGQSAAGWVLDYAYDPACPLRIERGKDWGKAFDALLAQTEEKKK
jgi:hypothetical protein